MQRRKQVCGGSEARLSSVIWHNEKVWNFHDVSGALAVRGRGAARPDFYHVVQLRRHGRRIAPRGRWSKATDGNFYGTTIQGGASCPPYGCGTIFKITPSGTLTMLHSFDGTDGNRSQWGDPGYQRELLRDNGRWRGQRKRHGLRNHPKRHADHTRELRRHGRPKPRSGADPSH